MSKHTRALEIDFAVLRSTVRAILLETGAAISPASNTTPEDIDDVIGDLVERRSPTLDAETRTVIDRVEEAGGRDIAVDVSNHNGAIMAAYEDAGYFVGVAMGLELAALTFGQLAMVPIIRQTRTRKGGRR